MMSSYSSVFRTSVWGGIPISLAAMAVFAFIGFYGLDLLVTRRKDDPRATAFLALATALPAVASIVMLIVSLTKLGTTCKLCVGIYIASALCVIGAVTLWRRAVALRATLPAEVGTAKSGSAALEIQVESPATSTNVWATWCKPCIEEMPRLARWRDKLTAAGKPFELAFVSVDEDPLDLAAFRTAHPQSPASPRLKEPAKQAEWYAAVGLDANAPIPIHIFVEPSGKVRCARAGGVRETDYAAIEKLLSE